MDLPNKRWAMGGGVSAVVRAAGDGRALGVVWQAIEAEAAASVFQSWLWLGCRFEARFAAALVLTIEAAGRVLAIGLIGRNRRFGLAQYHVAETGMADEDSVFIEFNGPLVVADRPAVRAAWYRALLERVVGVTGRLRLSGLGDDDAAAVRQAAAVFGGVTRLAPRRDLAGLRAREADCLATVSANTRQQINRAWRGYEASGAVVVTRAASVAEALDWLAALADLHSATWQARGRPGAFAGAAFQRFHTSLVARGVETGAVDVLRIAAGPRVIGYLYNFVWRGVVSAYQSGFAYEPARPQAKPGLVCHVAAMRHYQARGLDCYDFLAGADRYKMSLADGDTTLHWLTAVPRAGLLRPILAARARIGARLG
jgi:CelD/BcsL family acetyltransferase involved in cellulose biosynthesis